MVESNGKPAGGAVKISPTSGYESVTNFTVTLDRKWHLDHDFQNLYYKVWAREKEGSRLF